MKYINFYIYILMLYILKYGYTNMSGRGFFVMHFVVLSCLSVCVCVLVKGC